MCEKEMNESAQEAINNYRQLKEAWGDLSPAQKLLHKNDCPYRDSQEQGWTLNDD